MEITSVAKTLKYIDAGGIQIAAVYDRCRARDSERQRAAKHRASSAAQRRMNQIYSAQKLELMLSANFPTPGSALVVTLTHDDEHMPKSRKEAQARFKYFLKKLRAARAAAGLPERSSSGRRRSSRARPAGGISTSCSTAPAEILTCSGGAGSTAPI